MGYGPVVSRAKKNRRWGSGKSLGELDGTPSARRNMANLLGRDMGWWDENEAAGEDEDAGEDEGEGWEATREP